MSPLASVYNDPTQYGLEFVAVIADEFPDVLAVWRRVSDGALFYAQDQATEANEPFENYTSVEHLFLLEPETYLDFEVAVTSFSGSVDGETIDELLTNIKKRLNLLWRSGV